MWCVIELKNNICNPNTNPLWLRVRIKQQNKNNSTFTKHLCADLYLDCSRFKTEALVPSIFESRRQKQQYWLNVNWSTCLVISCIWSLFMTHTSINPWRTWEERRDYSDSIDLCLTWRSYCKSCWIIQCALHQFDFLFPTVSTGHFLWRKTVPLFCLFLTQLWHVVSTWSSVDLLRGSYLVKEVHFQGCSCSNQNSIIDFTSRGTQGSQGPWQFYLRKKLKGFESPRTAEEREGVRTGERVGDAPQDPSP